MGWMPDKGQMPNQNNPHSSSLQIYTWFFIISHDWKLIPEKYYLVLIEHIKNIQVKS